MPQDMERLLKETRCVIFDFDGVIADSEPLSLSTLRDTLIDFGLEMSIEDVRALFLGKSLKTIEAFVSAHSPNNTANGFGTEWQSTLFEKFAEELCPMPDLMALLDALDALELQYCVASSSSFERLGVALDAIRLRDRFPILFSSEQVKNGKPAPDIFLFAAAEMQCDPAACLVIEDSPYGIRAATAAGMRSLGFIGGSHLQGIEEEHATLLLESGAANVVTDFAQLIANTGLAHVSTTPQAG